MRTLFGTGKPCLVALQPSSFSDLQPLVSLHAIVPLHWRALMKQPSENALTSTVTLLRLRRPITRFLKRAVKPKDFRNSKVTRLECLQF